MSVERPTRTSMARGIRVKLNLRSNRYFGIPDASIRKLVPNSYQVQEAREIILREEPCPTMFRVMAVGAAAPVTLGSRLRGCLDPAVNYHHPSSATPLAAAAFAVGKNVATSRIRRSRHCGRHCCQLGKPNLGINGTTTST